MDSIGLISSLMSIGGILVGAVTHLYYKNIKFYRFTHKILKRKKEVFFNISFTYKIKNEQNFYKELENILKEIYPEAEIKKELNSSNNKIYDVPSYLIKVQVDKDVNGDENEPEIFIEIPKIRTYFSSVEKILDSVELLNEKIIGKLNILDSSYCLTIKFENTTDNVFVTPILRILGEKSIEKFNCKLNCGMLMSDLSDKTVDVFKDRIIISQDNFSDIRKLTPYLLLIKS